MMEIGWISQERNMSRGNFEDDAIMDLRSVQVLQAVSAVENGVEENKQGYF